jgi:hypothetical protein
MNAIYVAQTKLHGTRRGGPRGRPAGVAGAQKGRPYVIAARGQS